MFLRAQLAADVRKPRIIEAHPVLPAPLADEEDLEAIGGEANEARRLKLGAILFLHAPVQGKPALFTESVMLKMLSEPSIRRGADE